MLPVVEFWHYIKSFSQDWKTRMTSGSSLIIPFANVIAEKWNGGKLLPQWALVLIAALCFLMASFRVWRVEHRRLLTLPLRMLLGELDACRRHWKKHEHDYRKIGTPYFPFSGTPDFERWTSQNIHEFKDKISLGNEFRSHAQAVEIALRDLQDSRFPELIRLLSSPLYGSFNGQQLDEMIRDEEMMLRAKIMAIEKSGVKPFPAPENQSTTPPLMPNRGDSELY